MSLLFMVAMYDRTFERWPGAPPFYNYLLGGPVLGPLFIDKDSITIMTDAPVLHSLCIIQDGRYVREFHTTSHCDVSKSV